MFQTFRREVQSKTFVSLYRDVNTSFKAMASIGDWYTKEVQTWRRIGSTIWTCILLPPVTGLFFAAASFSLAHPYTWITGLLWFPFRPSVWFYSLLLMLVQVGLTLHKKSFYTVVPPIKSTIFCSLWSVLAPPRLLHTLSHAVGGGFISWCFVSMLGGQYSGLTKMCGADNSTTCLNEHHLFVVLSGLLLGAASSLDHFWQGTQHVSFPVVQQAKFFAVKSSMASLLTQSVKSVLRHLRGFYVFYFLFGSGIRHWFLRSLGIQQSDEAALSSLIGMIDLSLLWQCVVCGTLIHFLWSVNSLLFAMYITEPYQFPIESPPEEKLHCLHQALACSSHSIVQYLGFLDISLSSQHSANRRRQLFSLSQPGGHPHNWNRVVTECMTSLETLTNNVVAANRNSKAPVRNVSGESGRILPTPRRKLHPSAEDSVQYTSFTQDSFSNVSSPFYRDMTLHHRSGVGPANGSLNMTSPTNGHAPPLLQQQQQKDIATKPSVMEQLKKRPIFAYFLNDLPDVASRKLFADSQKQIWALEALSHLLVASYTEDTYGVVQKSLPDVMTAILSLQEAVERHFKLSPNISRKSDLESGLDASLRFSLKSTIKSSMYRIITTFGQHIRKIPLSTEHGRLLDSYMENRE